MKIALVTGSNQGIGFEIAKQLYHKNVFDLILLGCRNVQAGKEAMQQIISSPPSSSTKLECVPVDLAKFETILLLKEYLQSHSYRLQVLINNAATASHGPSLTRDIAANTLQVNYFGTKHLIEQLIDCMVTNGEARIINVSSMMGQYYTDAKSQSIKANISSMKLSDVDQLANDFIEAVAKNQVEQHGWRNNSYAVSKLLLNTFTQIYVRDVLPKTITMNCMCPGYTKTSMSSFKGTKTPAEGASTAVWLATDSSVKNETGGFYQDCKKTHF